MIDGYEGMEGNAPNSGSAVASRIALTSTDYRPRMARLCEVLRRPRAGQFDPSKIDVIGAKVADVRKSYRMHPDIERELKWQGPLTELPFNLG
jgi:uncharacterized protein (DUF362 family)